MSYETPKLTDYGDLMEVTLASGEGDEEDGTNKFHATFGSQPIVVSDERLKTSVQSLTKPLEALKTL